MSHIDRETVSEAAKPSPTDALQRELAQIVGVAQVSVSFVDRLAYSRDRVPFSTYTLRGGMIPATLPRAVVRPGNESELAAVLKLANDRDSAIVPYGAGSGVLGGAMPICEEITVDLKRLDGAPEIDRENMMVTVGAGVNGGVFEDYLNEKGYTCGHHPQSMHMSTVGGWVACRGAGQMSSRYGKIEDMVLGLRAVLPDGEVMHIKPVSRRAVGPGLMELIVGSEGTLAVITEATLKIWALPPVRVPLVVGFPTIQEGFAALRDMMRVGIRPSIARLYDEHESDEKSHESTDLSDNPVMCILEFAGHEKLVKAEMAVANDILNIHSAATFGNESFEKWKENRFSSYSATFHAEDGYVETIEITGLWSRLPRLYEDIRKAVSALNPKISFGAHWSHVYSEGACQYMTFRIPAVGDEQAFDTHAKLWRIVQGLTLEHGASISHHHGVGVFRNPWIEEELGGAMTMLRAVKAAVDPNNILNPGKLGLPTRDGSVLPIKKER